MRLVARRRHVVVLIQWRPTRVVRSCNGSCRNLSVEPLAPSASEANEPKSEDHADNHETDDDEDTGDSAFVVEKGIGRSAVASRVESTSGLVHDHRGSVDLSVGCSEHRRGDARRGGRDCLSLGIGSSQDDFRCRCGICSDGALGCGAEQH